MPEPNSTMKNTTPEEEIPYGWLIKPCEMYKEEYKDCKSIKARFHQYFIFGETLDCKQWKIDYDNCNLWSEHKDKEACKQLINSERKRRLERLEGHYKNDIWEKRDKPPENWNAPLPSWLEKESSKSYLRIVSDKLKENQDEKEEKKFCTIM
ncbi:UPF0545 protein C22orf39 homolog [Bombus affinis]|uniref:UPF0545 protein C22orf39 homolog n=1 Tax=Bombus affinis TaxID=309941 RepID=UPI0021B7DB3B|nr:UPF0545 protein C22orf39 homolog [Bombus affinis]XP_050586326.1 UPF0545 protein C22orf39 homolog [Bombus affinis]